MNDDFYTDPKAQSRVKAKIVEQYFGAWAHIIKPAAQKHNKRIGYVDFFAGPGRYNDGTTSTPVLILETVLKDPDLTSMFVSIFNDENKEFASSLEDVIKKVPGVERLRYKPQVKNISFEGSIEEFNEIASTPSLFFIDPWGYKGLSCDLIQRVVRGWGCEAIFFFNYNRIQCGIYNDDVRDHMNALFGESRVSALREKLGGLNPEEKEAHILSSLCEALTGCESKPYVLPFRFLDDKGTRTSHHLIFVTKSFKGYDKMKEVMAKASSDNEQGISTFSYVPASPQLNFLHGFGSKRDELRNKLLNKYSSKTISVKSLYEEDSVGTPFLLRNYREVLRELYDAKTVTAVRPNSKISRGFPEDIVVTFS